MKVTPGQCKVDILAHAFQAQASVDQEQQNANWKLQISKGTSAAGIVIQANLVNESCCFCRSPQTYPLSL